MDTLPDGTPCFAPVGRLVVVEEGERVVCHLCGRALVLLGAAHLRRHGWTAGAYREAFGLARGTSLSAPVLIARQRELGLKRFSENALLREGLATGQAMARDGRLLELSHAAQPAGTARAETRRGAGERTEALRHRTAQTAAQRLQRRLAELGFSEDLRGYLMERYLGRRLPVLALARELGVGNGRMKQFLDAAGVVRRRPGGAETARARWASTATDPGAR